MSAIENMMRMVLSSLDIDVEGMKTEVTSRIVAFEANIATLNATLIAISAEEKRNAAMLEKLCTEMGIEIPPHQGPMQLMLATAAETKQ